MQRIFNRINTLPKRVLVLKKFELQNPVVEYLQFWGGDFAPICRRAV